MRNFRAEVVDRQQLQIVAAQERRGDETVRVPRHVATQPKVDRLGGVVAEVASDASASDAGRRSRTSGEPIAPAETTTASPSIASPVRELDAGGTPTVHEDTDGLGRRHGAQRPVGRRGRRRRR